MAKRDLAGKAGSGHNVAAKAGEGEVVSKQEVKPTSDILNKNDGEQAKGPDNNKRLAYLEGQHSKLRGALSASGAFEFAEGEDAIDGALRLVDEVHTENATRLCRLRDFLTVKEPDGVTCLVREDEDEIGAAIRIIAERNNALATAAGDVKRLTGLVEALEARVMLPPEGENAEPDAVPCAGYDHSAAVAAEVATMADLDPAQGLTIHFGDGSAFVGPTIMVTPCDFLPAGKRGLFNQDVNFEASGSPATVTAAWLVDGDKAVRCELPGGLRIGGGAQARIPAGHLIF